MITPEEIEAMSAALVVIYEQIEDDLLRNVAGRFSVLDEVTPNTVVAWQLEKLQQMGALRRENLRVLGRYSGKTAQEIQRIIATAGYQALDLDELIYKDALAEGLLVTMPVPARASPILQQIIKGSLDNTRSYFNLINTTALQSAQESFLGIINQTYLETSLGITDYNTAVRKAVRDLADKGITGANYISAYGRRTRNHIDVAVKRCIVTSTAQTAGKMQIQRAKEWGCNLVEVSSHMGARPSHAVWQGRVYSLEGGTLEYPNLVAATEYGSVTGLMGANCRHVFYPFFEGISTQRYKPYDLQENARAYAQSQQQRAIERDVRQQKRRILTADATGDAESKLAAQLKLKAKELQLKQLISNTGRTQRTNRQQVLDFGRSEAMKAVWAKRKEPLPKVAKAADTVLQKTFGDPQIRGIIPQGADITKVRIIAGAGTSSEFRNASKQAEDSGGDALQWQKKGGIIESSHFIYNVHWNEYAGKQFGTKMKGRKLK